MYNSEKVGLKRDTSFSGVASSGRFKLACVGCQYTVRSPTVYDGDKGARRPIRMTATHVSVTNNNTLRRYDHQTGKIIRLIKTDQQPSEFIYMLLNKLSAETSGLMKFVLLIKGRRACLAHSSAGH